MRDFVIADCELTTGEIAALTGAKLREGDPVDRAIRNIAPLDAAGASDISFLDNSKYATELATTRAAACLIAPRFVERAPRNLVVLETAQPYPPFVAVTRKLFANLLRPHGESVVDEALRLADEAAQPNQAPQTAEPRPCEADR